MVLLSQNRNETRRDHLGTHSVSLHKIKVDLLGCEIWQEPSRLKRHEGN